MSKHSSAISIRQLAIEYAMQGTMGEQGGTGAQGHLGLQQAGLAGTVVDGPGFYACVNCGIGVFGRVCPDCGVNQDGQD